MNKKGKIIKSRREQQNDDITGEERAYVASQWQLIWWRFRKHKLAMAAGIILAFFYLVAVLCEFFAPYNPNRWDKFHIYVPPQSIHFIDEEGFHLRPFVYGLKQRIDAETLRINYSEDRTKKYPIYFLVRGDSYKLWGLFEINLHLIGAKEGVVFLLGSDRLGRDILSRIIYGARISLSIGLIGVFLSFVLGIIIGGVSGYYGGAIDTFFQRLIELLRSIPTIPLWMGLSLALPPYWSAIKVYLGITIILSVIGWTELARVVRGKFLSLREDDFVIAARLAGAKEARIMFRHMLPSFTSHIIASITLAIPYMILGETSLSFLGIGLRPPVVSWGVLLQEAQNIYTVALSPWLLLPGVFVIIVVLCFNFLGDGLRDAADPYTK